MVKRGKEDEAFFQGIFLGLCFMTDGKCIWGIFMFLENNAFVTFSDMCASELGIQNKDYVSGDCHLLVHLNYKSDSFPSGIPIASLYNCDPQAVLLWSTEC